jgi:hypothetical protein
MERRKVVHKSTFKIVFREGTDMKLRILLFIFTIFGVRATGAQSILVPMDEAQKNHLKAYGIAFYALRENMDVEWLLNYRGGSFLFEYVQALEQECAIRGVSFEVIDSPNKEKLLKEIANPAVNMNVVRMERAPRVAVYSPKNDLIPDETDAVILVLDYAEIPYTLLYDEEILRDELVKYDWLHLHHEDFTGQHERFQFRPSARMEAEIQKITAQRLGYTSISRMKLDVAGKIKSFCAEGGYLFAMCSGAETLDIALAAEGIELSASSFGDESETSPALDFSKTLAFENFTLEPMYSRKYSDINSGRSGYFDNNTNYFSLFSFSAKWDIIPSILTQNHEHVIAEFHGLTTAFSKHVVKPEVLILGENKSHSSVRYLYGELGRGHFTFYGGHDPEGSAGRWSEPTDLNLFPHSPGYRLILNNVLFPSAQKKKQKT